MIANDNELVSRLRWERRDRLTPVGKLQDAPRPRTLAEALRDRIQQMNAGQRN